MTISVRMDPLLERELELTAKRRGVTKSQFIIEAVERALGRKNPYELMQALKLEESTRPDYQAQVAAFAGEERSYDADASRAALVQKLQRKHGIRTG